MNPNLRTRFKTKKIRIGEKFIGGDSPILIQSMPTSHTKHLDETINQIHRLATAGCDIVRVAILDEEDANALITIKQNIELPLIADIHYDYKLALLSIKNGADKIRINPGNMKKDDGLKKIVQAAKSAGIPIRIGANSGSLSQYLIKKYNGVTADGIVESILTTCNEFEKMGFEDLILAAKSSRVPMSIESYRKLANSVPYPLHLGITESGSIYSGSIKSAMGIGTLLSEGIGDTIRVSLSCDPVEEIGVAKEILRGLEIRSDGVNIVSCPTCGRCRVDLFSVINRVEPHLRSLDKNITVAIMGCSVNGPGEAREADIGIAGGVDKYILFKKGECIQTIDTPDEAVEVLMREIKHM